MLSSLVGFLLCSCQRMPLHVHAGTSRTRAHIRWSCCAAVQLARSAASFEASSLGYAALCSERYRRRCAAGQRMPYALCALRWVYGHNEQEDMQNQARERASCTLPLRCNATHDASVSKRAWNSFGSPSSSSPHLRCQQSDVAMRVQRAMQSLARNVARVPIRL